MDEDAMVGRTPVLEQMIGGWRDIGPHPTWAGLSAALQGLSEALCLIRWPSEDRSVIAQAGAHAVLAYGTALVGASANALTPGRFDGAKEAAEALKLGRPFTVEDQIASGGRARRVARLYLPLHDIEPAVACGVVRID